MTEYERKLTLKPTRSTARTHIVLQESSWYEGEVLCCGWIILSDVMAEGQAHAYAREFPNTKLWLATDELPKPLRMGGPIPPCDGR